MLFAKASPGLHVNNSSLSTKKTRALTWMVEHVRENLFEDTK